MYHQMRRIFHQRGGGNDRQRTQRGESYRETSERVRCAVNGYFMLHARPDMAEITTTG
jgi:hypothetical protein